MGEYPEENEGLVAYVKKEVDRMTPKKQTEFLLAYVGNTDGRSIWAIIMFAVVKLSDTKHHTLSGVVEAMSDTFLPDGIGDQEEFKTALVCAIKLWGDDEPIENEL